MNLGLTDISTTERDLEIGRLAARYRAKVKAKLLSTVQDPIDLLDPKALAELLGVDYLELPEIADEVYEIGTRRSRKASSWAGYLDRRENCIVVSQDFKLEEMRFTAAHELGHYLLHPAVEYRRERPARDVTVQLPRPREEYEADRFATEWLMPRKWITSRLKKTFDQALPIKVDYNLAWLLFGDNYERLFYATDDLAHERAIASRSLPFGSSHLPPMKEQFKVSETAMALRLQELRAVVRG